MTPNFSAFDWFLSVSAFATINFPSYSFAMFSKVGPRALQGPHHSAQKSTRTGVSLLFSITSFSNVSSVTLIFVMGSVIKFFL